MPPDGGDEGANEEMDCRRQLVVGHDAPAGATATKLQRHRPEAGKPAAARPRVLVGIGYGNTGGPDLATRFRKRTRQAGTRGSADEGSIQMRSSD